MGGQMTERTPVHVPTIAIVEPDHYIAKALRIALELTLTVETVVAEDAADVMPLMIERRPALVAIDVYTRRFNAFEVIADLKRNRLTSDIPVIAMGPRGDQGAFARAMGCVDTLSLPFRVNELTAKMLKHAEVQPKPHRSGRASSLT